MRKLKVLISLIIMAASLIVIMALYFNYGVILDGTYIPVALKIMLCCALFVISGVYLVATKGGSAHLFTSVPKGIAVVLLCPILTIVCTVVALAGSFLMTQAGFAHKYLDTSMDISAYADKWNYNPNGKYYALKDVVYVELPKDTVHQSMNIFIPAVYLNKDGSINPGGTVNGYTAATAPIVYQNNVSGYMQGTPDVSVLRGKEYLEQGFVFVSVGSRGIGSKSGETYIGKSPEGLVDLKAGIRFLRHNDAVLPGSCGKIISVGTSAGGAMSSLLGSTGNNAEYLPYLERIGALMDSGDDIFAAMCYCPIIDLEHADMAYEWMFNKDSDRQDAFNKAVSDALVPPYISYFNSYQFKNPDTLEILYFNEDGRSGTMYDLLMAKLEASAAKFLSKSSNASGYVSKYAWLSFDGGMASITKLDDMVGTYRKRMKNILSFDSWDLDKPENKLFGNETTEKKHFDPYIADVLETLKDRYPAGYEKYHEAYLTVQNDEGLLKQTQLLNPMYMLQNVPNSNVAPNFRIRVGTQDADTSWMIALSLALSVKNNTGSNVDFAFVWDEPHTNADYKGEFVEWINSIY